MAIPSFIDRVVTTTGIGVVNRSTTGSNSYLSASTSIRVGLDPDSITDPNVGDVVLAQDSIVVQRTGLGQRGVGSIYRGSSASTRVVDEYYADLSVTVFANQSRPAAFQTVTNVSQDLDKRVYWG